MDDRTNKKISAFITSIINLKFNLVKAYLFGSYALGKDIESSDIDVALVMQNMNSDDRFDLQVKLMYLASEFDLRIEPHPFSMEDFDSDIPIVREIIKTGIEIEPMAPSRWFSKA